MTVTRSENKKVYNLISRAVRYNIIPDFDNTKKLNEQSTKTRWALHVLAVLSKNRKPHMSEVISVIDQTNYLFK